MKMLVLFDCEQKMSATNYEGKQCSKQTVGSVIIYEYQLFEKVSQYHFGLYSEMIS